MTNEMPLPPLNMTPHEAMLNLLLEQIRDHAVFEMDESGTITSWNRTLGRVFNYAQDEIINSNFSILLPPDQRHPDRISEILQRALETGRYEDQLSCQRRNGQKFQGHIAIVAVNCGESYVVTLRDMSMLLATQDQLHALATADQMTGLANRQHLFDLGRVEYRRWKRYRVPLSMIIADVDKLGTINSRHGMEAGDSVLRDVADVFMQCVRDVDMVARIHGGTFVIMLFSTPQEGAAVLAERIRSAVNKSEFILTGTTTRATLTIAALTANESSPDFDSFVKQSEDILTEAKRLGGDRIVIA